MRNVRNTPRPTPAPESLLALVRRSERILEAAALLAMIRPTMLATVADDLRDRADRIMRETI